MFFHLRHQHSSLLIGLIAYRVRKLIKDASMFNPMVRSLAIAILQKS
jgi:hypothetical protein